MSLIIRKCKQKSAMRYPSCLLRWPLKKKDEKYWQECGENWNPCMLLVGMQNGTPAMGNSMKVPQKNKKLNYYSAVPLLGIYPARMEMSNLEEISALPCSTQ